jgi:GMP synthase-like glutamine amidotransferase
MRSLIVRFLDSEGPGIIESSLKENGYKITYHDSYKKGLELVPESQQIFDLILLMGGPQTVYNESEYEFFKPYLNLVEQTLSLPNKKIIGVCLGSQILAKVLGAKVEKGKNGSEIGFSKLQIKDSSHPIFSNLKSDINTFHLHNDTFDLPTGSKLLASSEKYENQIFDYKNIAFGIQCHLEVTPIMLQTWWKVHKLNKQIGELNSSHLEEAKEMNELAKPIFDKMIKG